ncbi:hypothetical protein ZWY2020_009323 [Hordeum vulgare]|nr:hypothetical protein ZWY2020_009323 [Hordeum vulgare]
MVLVSSSSRSSSPCPWHVHSCWASTNLTTNKSGKTIYSAIISFVHRYGHGGCNQVTILYFGGIKLGTGGLVRAYGGVASECLKDAPTCLVKPKSPVGMEVQLDLLGTVYNQIIFADQRLTHDKLWLRGYHSLGYPVVLGRQQFFNRDTTCSRQLLCSF